MGYRGQLQKQEEARKLRAEGRTLLEIATALDASKSSISTWVRDVSFTPSPRRTGAHARHQPLRERRLREVAEHDRLGRERIGVLSGDEFLVAGLALYAGEGGKRDAEVLFANTDPRMIQFHCSWLRTFFSVDESRLRVRVYLHEGLDLDRAEAHWSVVTGVPRSQFRAPYRAAPDATIRHNKHEFGCCYVRYYSSSTHRAITGMIRALLSFDAIPG
jgi:hypothetical protein